MHRADSLRIAPPSLLPPSFLPFSFLGSLLLLPLAQATTCPLPSMPALLWSILAPPLHLNPPPPLLAWLQEGGRQGEGPLSTSH